MATSLKSRFDYDVFLSFRGPDCRNSFCKHRCRALAAQGIKFFPDNVDILKGQDIMQAIMNALARSSIILLIFSASYANSRWCLEELAEIMRRRELMGLLVVPIFYGIQSIEVRRQLNAYGEALKKRKCRGHSESKVEEWSLALSLYGGLFAGSQSRGDDVRGFVQSLYEALVEKGINAFMDSEKLRKGEDFPPTLMDAIEQSRMYVVIFSENCAESPWCLDELVEILEGENIKQRKMLPVFYKVEPSEVRGQRQSYGKALKEHEIKQGKGSEAVEKWRKALSEAANVRWEHLQDG